MKERLRLNLLRPSSRMPSPPKCSASNLKFAMWQNLCDKVLLFHLIPGGIVSVKVMMYSWWCFILLRLGNTHACFHSLFEIGDSTGVSDWNRKKKIVFSCRIERTCEQRWHLEKLAAVPTMRHRHLWKTHDESCPFFSSHFPPTACCLIAFSFSCHFIGRLSTVLSFKRGREDR